MNTQPDADTHALPEDPNEGDAARANPASDPFDDRASRPGWSVGAAIVVWVTSVLAIIVVPALAVLVYLFVRSGATGAGGFGTATLGSDPNLLLVGIAATLPAHLLTFGLVWAVVSGAGRRPFWRAIGWGKLDARSAALWAAVAAIVWVLVRVVIAAIVHFTGAGKTSLDVLIETSPQARIVIAMLAVLTAPIVEELVYRGVLYPALRGALGVRRAILIVAGLFAAVHFQQYAENPGLIVGVTLLSVILTIVRERTNSLAPCFVIHIVFNLITAMLFLLYPNLGENAPKPPPASVTYTASSSPSCQNHWLQIQRFLRAAQNEHAVRLVAAHDRDAPEAVAPRRLSIIRA